MFILIMSNMSQRKICSDRCQETAINESGFSWPGLLYLSAALESVLLGGNHVLLLGRDLLQVRICPIGLERPDVGQSHEGFLWNPDHILLALMQGGLRAQLSGLESEIREGEKAVFRTSLHPWVLPINLPRDLWSQFHTSTKYSRLKLALEWSLRDQGH